MQVDIYKSVAPSGSYVAVPSGSPLPQQMYNSIGNVEVYKKNLPIEPQSKLYAVDAPTVLYSIQQQGFYFIKDTTQPDVSKAGAAIGGGILLASIGLGPIGAILGAVAGFAIANSAEKKIFDPIDAPKQQA
jgi:uncharacterized protein YcgL (UPF0745 family)